MYHCNVCFYYVGDRPELLEVIKNAEPLKHFTHEFITSAEPEGRFIEKANVIIADLQGANVEATLRILLYYKKEETQLILLADKEQTRFLMEQDVSAVTDIWPMPLSEEEMRFRFLRWQQINKMSKDYWQTQNYLDTTINSMPHMIWYKDRTGAHMKVNDFFCKTVNKTMEQIEGRGHYYIWDLTPDDYAKGEFICMESEFEVMDKRETCIFDEDVKISDEIRKLQTYKTPLFDLDGSVMGTVGVALDVTDLLMYQEMLIKNANTDALTGLANRRYAYEYVDQLEDNHITIFGIDLDNFKSVNDIYGHQEGDHALILTAQVLRECMPESLIVRNGGDEFMVIMLGEHTKEEIEEQRKMIETNLDRAFSESQNLKEISASVGAAYTDRGKDYFDKLVAEADALMYSQKEGKKRR